jgi:hypothetical protein
MGLFTSIFGGKAKTTDLDAPLASLDDVRLQVFSTNYFGIRALDPAISALRPLAPGLVMALVQDLGAASRTLTWDQLRAFGKSDDELFDLGRRQGAHADKDVASQQIDAVQTFACNGFYLSAKLLHTFIEKPLKKGVLVAPVSSHHWCTHIIQSGVTVPPHIAMVAYIAEIVAQNMQATDAERLVTDVYWIRPGGRQMDRIALRDGTPVLSPELERAMQWD